MFQRDFILRMIEQFVKVIAKVLLNKEAGNYDSALDEIQKSYSGIFGIDKELISVSSAEEIISLLKLRGKDKPKVFLMLAEFLKEEAEIHKSIGDVSKDKIDDTNCKSLSLYLEAVLNSDEVQSDENYEKINALLKETEGIRMMPGLSIKVLRYFELIGEYDKAENVLFELIESSPSQAALEGERLFRSLNSKSDEDLLKGNFSREEIEQGRTELDKRIKNVTGTSRSW